MNKKYLGAMLDSSSIIAIEKDERIAVKYSSASTWST